MLAWRRLLPCGGLFVDVGANVGLYTIWALDCGAEVIAVEPHDGSAAELERNLALNDYQATVLRVAMADKPGLLRLEGPDLPRQHLVVNARTAAPTGDEVQVETLDAVLGDRVASGVKVDVEGAEALVLAGATVALSEHRIKALQLEWNECSEQLLGEDRGGVVEMLASHGYVLFRPDPRGELVAATDFSYGRDMFALPLP